MSELNDKPLRIYLRLHGHMAAGVIRLCARKGGVAPPDIAREALAAMLRQFEIEERQRA
jgi:hypothetical protein